MISFSIYLLPELIEHWKGKYCCYFVVKSAFHKGMKLSEQLEKHENPDRLVCTLSFKPFYQDRSGGLQIRTLATACR